MLGEDTPRSRGIWVIGEHRDGRWHAATWEVLEEARVLAAALDVSLSVVLLGYQIEALTSALGERGAGSVYLSDHPLLLTYSTDAYLAVLVALVADYRPRVLMLSHTPNGEDLAARLAARLRWTYVGECVAAKAAEGDALEITRPMYQNRVHAVLRVPAGACAVVTLRPGVRAAGRPSAGPRCEIVRTRPELSEEMLRVRSCGFIPADPATVDLSEAEVIVAGGRGVGGPSRWHVVQGLASSLAAAVGGSRVALDEGCIPRQRVIGQTGKSIRPRLYFAVGISGATQHVGAIRDSELIVAINSDPAAPILKLADLGVVGDLHDIVPSLIRSLDGVDAKQPVEDGRLGRVSDAATP